MSAGVVRSVAFPEGRPPERLATALAVLHEARRYAAELEVSPWEFAVEWDDLARVGATHNDLRWLMAQGALEHGVERTRPRDLQRTFRFPAGRTLGSGSCFVLTSLGASWTEELVRALTAKLRVSEPREAREPATYSAAVVRPAWDAERRELRFRGRLVKRFRSPAPNQERVLAALEEEAWPPRIDDPLPPHADQDSKRRLRDTIATLNRGQDAIRFFADGRGQGIRWEPASGCDDDGQLN
jgi:hypothetical protein